LSPWRSQDPPENPRNCFPLLRPTLSVIGHQRL
jgi:hypothetical protein